MAVLLIGASGLAREVLATGATRAVVGVLDDDPAREGALVGGVRVIGPLELAVARGDDLLVCIGSGSARRAVVERLAALGVGPDRYAIAVHPAAVIGAGVEVGAGSIVLPGTVATADAVIGRHVVLMPNCSITHDDRLEDFATLASGVALGGSVRVGVAAYLGMNATVRQGARIGADAIVGMGAAVLDDVPDRETWVGVPAGPLPRGAEGSRP